MTSKQGKGIFSGVSLNNSVPATPKTERVVFVLGSEEKENVPDGATEIDIIVNGGARRGVAVPVTYSTIVEKLSFLEAQVTTLIPQVTELREEVRRQGDQLIEQAVEHELELEEAKVRIEQLEYDKESVRSQQRAFEQAMCTCHECIREVLFIPCEHAFCKNCADQSEECGVCHQVPEKRHTIRHLN